MNAVAGPGYRYDLMSRRWSILGITTAITAVMAGQVLIRIDFPINYQIVFISLSIGGLLSYYYSSHIVLPDAVPGEDQPDKSSKRLFGFTGLIWKQKNFVSFSAKRYVFLFGTLLATPILPLYYVKVVDASDAWIGIISTSQTAVLVFGYYIWTRSYRSRGSRFVLLCTTLGLSLTPALVAQTNTEIIIALLAGITGIFQAGLDLVFFDELMKTVPEEYSATFVSFSQGLQYSASILAPLLGTQLSGYIGLGGVLMVSAGIRLIGFLLFLLK
jgi:Na+/melibiose symporter-like transporter